MPRKKNTLNQRQQSRILAIHTQRVARSREKIRDTAERLLDDNTLGPEIEGLVIVHYGLNVVVEDDHGGRWRCAVRETVPNDPVCGDRVIWRQGGEGEGVITGLMPRTTVLQRPIPYEGLRAMAANVDRMVVVTSAGDPNLGLVDRYLVAASAAGIEPLIVINKYDLLAQDKELRQGLKEFFKPYKAMDYQVLRVSARQGEGLDDLEAALVDHVSVFVGHSGVGKSSLISRWAPPDQVLRIGAVHAPTGRGRNTTAVAQLYHLPAGGALIDSPGVREFGLESFPAADVARHFRDLAPYLGLCRFSDCSHRHEPQCAVLRAVKKGEVDFRRLESYYRIVDSLP